MWTKQDLPEQKGKTIIVTGTNTGIGFETALALYQAGANVILACRNLKKADDTLTKLQEVNGKGNSAQQTPKMSTLIRTNYICKPITVLLFKTVNFFQDGSVR